MTEAEIVKIIQLSNLNSATGADGVSYKIIREVMAVAASILSKLFDNLLRHVVFPRSWKHARCDPFPKPGRTDIPVPKSLRPISLLSCLGKTLEKILTQRIARAGAETGVRAAEHMGSRANLSAIDTLMTRLSTAQEWLMQKSKPSKLSWGLGPDRPSLVENDMDEAFNCVLHGRLAEAMEHY